MFKFFKRKKFVGIAVKKEFITQRQFEQALEEQRKSRAIGSIHKKIGVALLEKSFLEIGDIDRRTFLSWVGAFVNLKRGI